MNDTSPFRHSRNARSSEVESFLAAGFTVFECQVENANGSKDINGMPRGVDYEPGKYIPAVPSYKGKTNAHLAWNPGMFILDRDSEETDETVRIMEVSNLLEKAPTTKTRRGHHSFYRRVPGREHEYPASSKFDKLDLKDKAIVRRIVNDMPLYLAPTITPQDAWMLFGKEQPQKETSAKPIPKPTKDDDWQAIDGYARTQGVLQGDDYRKGTIFRVAWYYYYIKGCNDRELIAERCLARNQCPYPTANHDEPLGDDIARKIASNVGYNNGRSTSANGRIENRRRGVHSGRVRLERRIPEIEIALGMLDDGVTKSEVAKRLGVDRKTLWSWMNAVVEGRCTIGGGVLCSRHTMQHHDPTFDRRKRVRTLLKRGITQQRISELCNVDKSTISRDKQWIEKHPDAFKSKRKTNKERLVDEWGKAADLVIDIDKERKSRERKSKPVVNDTSRPKGVFGTAMVRERVLKYGEYGGVYSDVVQREREGWLYGGRFVLKDRWTPTGKRKHVEAVSVVRFTEHKALSVEVLVHQG